MEALAAFGVACNVMQTIKFTFEVVEAGKKVFRDGSPDPRLQELVQSSTQAYTKLEESLVAIQHPNADERELIRVAQNCLNAASALTAEVAKVNRPAAKGSIWISFKTGTRAKFVARKIDKLKADMGDHQRELELRVLMRACKQADALRIQQESRFNGLDTTLQGFIVAYGRGQTLLKDLLDQHTDAIKTFVKSETHQSQQAVSAHITSESSRIRDELIYIRREAERGPPIWKKRQNLLRSLKYDSMNERFNQITECYEGTYRWILEGIRPWLDDDKDVSAPGGKTSHLHPDCSHAIQFPNVIWKCFRCWLESPTGKLYWIQGKAGSGKSTLMKYLALECGDTFTDPNAERPLILSHFLWASGSALQRSILGILLNLVQQFLSKQESVLDAVLEHHPEATLADRHSDWTREQLERIVKTWFPRSERPILIFLDGLDEINDIDANRVDTPETLLRLLKMLGAIDKVRLCVSSRERAEFRLQLQKMPTLRLQDITRQDMKTYADCYLLQPEFTAEFEEAHKAYQDLVETLCDKADGVFLWLALAVRSLSRGIANGDDLSELKIRVERMPAGLCSLYQEMWSKMNEDQSLYQAEAAMYFNMVLDWSQFAMGYSLIEVFHLLMASEPSKARAILHDPDIISPAEIEEQCRSLSRRINARTAGLLEVAADGRLVGFVHRSAVEFLQNTPDGRQILGYDRTPASIRHLNLIYAFLAGVALQMTGRRETKAYSPVSEDFVIGVIHRAWESGVIPDDDGHEVMAVCKRLHETVKWRSFHCGSDSAQLIHSSLDFYGVTTSFGFTKVLTRLLDSALSPHSRRYLFAASCLDPNVSSEVNMEGKAHIAAEILNHGRVFDLEDHESELPTMLFAALNMHAGGKCWPRTLGVPSLPVLIEQYIGSPRMLEAKLSITLRRRPPNGNGWWPNLHCLGVIETMYWRQSSNWVTVETDLASLIELTLSARALGSDTDSPGDLQAIQRSLVTLKTAVPRRSMRVIAFGFVTTNIASRSIVKDRDGKPLAPATEADSDAVVSCLAKAELRPSGTDDDDDGDDREYYVPGLWECLQQIAEAAPAMEESELEQAKDLPLRRAFMNLMTEPPKTYTE
ncbi:hypothetical protein OQA88_11755 [Cercophora sp. LCS_1]